MASTNVLYSALLHVDLVKLEQFAFYLYEHGLTNSVKTVGRYPVTVKMCTPSFISQDQYLAKNLQSVAFRFFNQLFFLQIRG
jgi:hypothetical protein